MGQSKEGMAKKTISETEWDSLLEVNIIID